MDLFPGSLFLDRNKEIGKAQVTYTFDKKMSRLWKNDVWQLQVWSLQKNTNMGKDKKKPSKLKTPSRSQQVAFFLPADRKQSRSIYITRLCIQRWRSLLQSFWAIWSSFRILGQRILRSSDLIQAEQRWSQNLWDKACPQLWVWSMRGILRAIGIKATWNCWWFSPNKILSTCESSACCPEAAFPRFCESSLEVWKTDVGWRQGCSGSGRCKRKIAIEEVGSHWPSEIAQANWSRTQTTRLCHEIVLQLCIWIRTSTSKKRIRVEMPGESLCPFILLVQTWGLGLVCYKLKIHPQKKTQLQNENQGEGST